MSFRSGWTNLETVIIGDSTPSIGSTAFASCRSLISVTIGNSVTSIGSNCFQQNNSLTNVTIGESITNIGSYAFDNCRSMESIICKATTPPTLGSDAFNSTNNAPIYVPAESVEIYKAASGWSDYASRIQAITN